MHMKRKLECIKEREKQLRREREQKCQKRVSRVLTNHLNCLNYTESPVTVEQQLLKPDQDLLEKFYTELNKLTNKFVPHIKSIFHLLS